jgi:hypothetical protein
MVTTDYEVYRHKKTTPDKILTRNGGFTFVLDSTTTYQKYEDLFGVRLLVSSAY